MRVEPYLFMGMSLAALVSLGACSVYEDNFTARGQLYKNISGAYGVNPECEYDALMDDTIDQTLKPDLVIIDYYQVYDRLCRLDDVQKDGSGFILKPPLTCRDEQLKEIDPFHVRVEAINENEVKFQETGKASVTVYRCGSKVN